jgi:NDP-sugar pyrophosphorylase family protein
LTDFDYSTFYDHHLSHNNLFTVACCQREEKSEFGVLEIEKNRLVGFTEKPIAQYMVSMGIYMANKRVLEHIPENRFYGFDLLMLKLINLKENASTYQHPGFWLDIGRSNDYAEANEKFEHMKEAIIL